jgi:Domain of unknown function (DUF3786)
MSGLIDQAGGIGRRPAEEVIHRARQAWQDSMLRPIDDLARSLRQSDPAALAHRSGCGFDGQALDLAYWGERIRLPWPELVATRVSDGKACSTFDQAMLLYYLESADGASASGRWIGFRELPNGAFYAQAYQGYSGDRMAHAFGPRPESDLGTSAFAFVPLPRIRLAAVLWPGDEEFSARGAVLFDPSDSHYMTTDGLALLGSGLVGRLLRAVPSGS